MITSKYFSEKEVFYLPSWGIMHSPTEEELVNINKAIEKFEIVREFLDKPMKVHCWIRPAVVRCAGSRYDGKDYNKFVGGAPHSAHVLGLAIDFDIGEDCNETRKTLLPMLEKWELRMENHEGPWVHLDLMPPNPNRYFIP